ncbi:MAG: hypothetical protein ACD_80C00147G0015 [uncultured bacterium (gcode 4)]|uniref:Uncharacterized protein n=1 Tax=uncultured bacterium (gcode 4) TaxID=1234023 RepID=K1XHV8_9BACT|nr:MAG: hypothetical protein ACD_80C00147G0015 [uncultured bacterium (gcode 4)]
MWNVGLNTFDTWWSDNRFVRDENTIKTLEQWHVIDAKLKNVYFFTQQQINTVFDKFQEHDSNDFHVIDKIINDVEQKYRTIPYDTHINDYLYETLMSVEDRQSENIQNIYQDVFDHPEKYIDVPHNDIIHYNNFKKPNQSSDEVIYDTIRTYIEQYVQIFFLIHIHEDISLSDTGKKKLPKNIQNFLKYSEYRWINFYVFIQNDWQIKIAPGVFGWSTWRANDAIFGKIISESDAKKITLPLSSLLSLHE